MLRINSKNGACIRRNGVWGDNDGVGLGRGTGGRGEGADADEGDHQRDGMPAGTETEHGGSFHVEREAVR